MKEKAKCGGIDFLSFFLLLRLEATFRTGNGVPINGRNLFPLATPVSAASNCLECLEDTFYRCVPASWSAIFFFVGVIFLALVPAKRDCRNEPSQKLELLCWAESFPFRIS